MKRLMLIMSLSGLALLFNGCTPSPSTPEKPTVDPTLPKIYELKTLSDITEIGLEWTPIHDLRIEGYHIYRAEADANNGTLSRIATISDRYISHFVDTKLAPQTNYIYRISSFSAEKRESEPSATARVATTPTIEPIPFVSAMVGLPNRIKLIWRPHPSERVSAYYIERNDFGSTKWQSLATINGRLNAEYIDAGLNDSKSYRYRITAKTYDGLSSAVSHIVEAQTKPLPPIVENLRITRDLPQKITISWDASTYPDAVHYKIYRANHSSLFYSYLVKTNGVTYDDVITDDGVARYYYVTVVDKDGLESPRQNAPIMGTTLAVPSAPAVNVVKNDSRSIMLGWQDTSFRATKYQISRSSKSGSVTYINIGKNTFIDEDVTSGVEYTYTVFAIDQYGLISKPSDKVIATIPAN